MPTSVYCLHFANNDSRDSDSNQTGGGLISLQCQFHAGPRGAQPPRLWIGPPNLAIPLTHCGRLILIKNSNFHATRCQIIRLKCTEFDFRARPAYGIRSCVSRLVGPVGYTRMPTNHRQVLADSSATVQSTGAANFSYK